jgi:hypothetical protein
MVNMTLKSLVLFFTFQFPMAFAGPAEVAREALNHQAIWFDSASGALTVLATNRDTVSKGQLRNVVELGYCDSVLSGRDTMDKVKIVNVINSARTHGFVFIGGQSACEEISDDEYLDSSEITDIIVSHSVAWAGKEF